MKNNMHCVVREFELNNVNAIATTETPKSEAEGERELSHISTLDIAEIGILCYASEPSFIIRSANTPNLSRKDARELAVSLKSECKRNKEHLHERSMERLGVPIKKVAEKPAEYKA